MKNNKNKIVAGVIGLIAIVGIVNTQVIIKLSRSQNVNNQDQMAQVVNSRSKSISESKQDVYNNIVKKINIGKKTKETLITSAMAEMGTAIITDPGYYKIKICGGGGGGGGGGIGANDFNNPVAFNFIASSYPFNFSNISLNNSVGGGGGAGGGAGQCKVFSKVLQPNNTIVWTLGSGGDGGLGSKLGYIIPGGQGGNVSNSVNIQSTSGGVGGNSSLYINGSLTGTVLGGASGVQALNAVYPSALGGVGSGPEWNSGENGRISGPTTYGCESCGGFGGDGVNSTGGNISNVPSGGGDRGWWTSADVETATGFIFPTPPSYAVGASVGLTAYGRKGLDADLGYGGGGGGGGYGLPRVRTALTSFPPNYSLDDYIYIWEMVSGGGGRGGDGYITINYFPVAEATLEQVKQH